MEIFRWRLEIFKFREALIKLSTVATDIFSKSGRAMIDALIAGERNPEALADLALGRMRKKTASLTEALNGRFDQHHAELARISSTRSTGSATRSSASPHVLTTSSASSPTRRRRWAPQPARSGAAQPCLPSVAWTRCQGSGLVLPR